MKRIIITGIAAIMLFSRIDAQNNQKLWTLEECISYAYENNINLKQREQDEESAKIDLRTGQSSWLPNLNASLGQNMGFGRTTSREGIIVDKNSTTSSFNMQTSMSLFNGFKITNDIAARKLNLMAATESLNKAKEDLAINVTSYYLTALYNKELVYIAELHVNFTREQVKRTEALLEEGKVPVSQLSNINAQLAKDELTFTEARNNASLALLDLAQVLELERFGTAFDIVMPEVKDVMADNMQSIISPEDIYANAVAFKPQIKEQEFLLESRKKSLRMAQADYYPRLSLSANYSNGYYRFGENDVAFNDQLKQNAQKGVSVSLSIPIFNRFVYNNNVRKVRIGIANQELSLENSKKMLYKEIQQAYFTAVAAQAKYVASEKSVIASKEAFDYAEESYAVGKSSVFEYNESKMKYAASLLEQAQAKYTLIFRAKILDFYNGIEIRL